VHTMKVVAVKVKRYGRPDHRVLIGEDHVNIGMDYAWPGVVGKRLEKQDWASVDCRCWMFGAPCPYPFGDDGKEILE
jgi:hypothetical protein